MKTFTISFYECEHQGDLDNYIGDMSESGAEIMNTVIDYDSEIGTVQYRVSDHTKFMEKFEETESYGFVN